MPRAFPKPAALALAILALVSLEGCGYTLRPPYNPDVQTVYVPVFRSTVFRRDINLQITQLLIDEINQRTPFRVVQDPEKADATLQGVIAFDDKNVLVENPYNLPRHLVASMRVNVTFTDNRTGTTTERTIPAAQVFESAAFYPEIGESAGVGFMKLMELIVRDIVNMMEEPWGPEYVARDQELARRQADEREYQDDEEEEAVRIRR